MKEQQKTFSVNRLHSHHLVSRPLVRIVLVMLISTVLGSLTPLPHLVHAQSNTPVGQVGPDRSGSGPQTHNNADASTLSIDALLTSQIAKVTGADVQPGDNFGVVVALDNDTALAGAPYKGGETGAAYIFERNQGGTNAWGQVIKLTASDAQAGDGFGWDVALSGDTALVGAHRGSGGTGAAYIFQRNHGGANAWGQVARLTASDAAVGDEFGNLVALDGDTALVGASYKDSQTGTAYIFERNQGGVNVWGQVTKLTPSHVQPGSYFGESLALSGDTALASAFGEDNFAGAVYIFERNQGGANSWGQVARLTASDAQPGDYFGQVALDGDTTLVGANQEDGGLGNPLPDAGAAYIFRRNQGGANSWGQVAKLAAADAQAGDWFGNNVAVAGDTALVGTPLEDGGLGDLLPDAGAAYIFQRNQGGANNWGQMTKLTAADAQAGDGYGYVALSGDTALVGANQKNSFAGAAYVYDLTEPATAPPGLVLWNQLGSDEQVLHSAFGPDLRFYQDGDCTGNCIGVEVKANPAYVPGVFGQAVGIGAGPYFSAARVYNVVLDDALPYLNPERGTVEAWYQQTIDPVAYAHGIYRVFGGGFGFVGSGIGFWAYAHDEGPRFDFDLAFGGSNVAVHSDTDGLVGYDISPYNQTWIHLAGVWDRQGIAGSADTLRLYLNGEQVASSQENGWGTEVGQRIDIAGGNDGEIAGKFYIDNLKLWNIAKTDFSDRFVEGFAPLIVVTKTVGLAPDSCSDSSTLTVPAGTTVYYCYTVHNTGALTYTRHAVDDSHLGSRTVMADLPPGEMLNTVDLGLTFSATLDITTTNTVTWTAHTSGDVSATAMASATVNVPPPPVGGVGTITIVKDAQPNSRRNFRFTDDLGDFRLDNVLPSDGDAYTQSQTFTLQPGVYRVREAVPGNWLLSNITCDPPTSAAVNLVDNRVTIMLTGARPITCTFTNYKRSILRVEKYHDANGDAQRNQGEASLSGWTLRLYDAQQTLVAAQVTNERGKVSFTGLHPGNYTVCEALTAGWYNTQPGLIDPTLQQPCYALTLGPGQIAQVSFGNVDQPVARSAHLEAGAGVVISLAPDGESDDALYEEVESDDAYLNTPAGAPRLYLPLIPIEK